MIAAFLIAAILWLAWSNGGNDNFKGVATLYGSAAASYKTALLWASLATLAGSLLSLFLAAELLKSFSGNGIVPGALTTSSMFLLSVALAGAATIFLATLAGMPTSTTHALTGALIGAGLVASPSAVNWAGLGAKFFLPLLLSPMLAVILAMVVYGTLHLLRKTAGINYDACVCATSVSVQPAWAGNLAALQTGGSIALTIGQTAACAADPAVTLNMPVKRAVDVSHFLSAGAVCFARALNDTPKIAALLLVGGAVGRWSIPLVAVAMIAGGFVNSRRVAQTMARKITDLNPGQGLSASLVTASLVLAASCFGLPVSTTHVSVGAIFGIGAVTGHTRWKTVLQIAVAWISTLPAGLVLGAVFYWTLLKSGL